jgi:hypothetical protein
LEQFGSILGIDDFKIISFSCNDLNLSNQNESSNITINNKKIYCGIKWQCVELVRRWLIINKSITFQQINYAYELFYNEILFFNPFNESIVTVNIHNNGSKIKPHIGSLIIWDSTDKYITGHVAVVVNIDNNYIYISEQNWTFNKWSNNYSRSILINKNINRYYLDDSDTNPFNCKILGWINYL